MTMNSAAPSPVRPGRHRGFTLIELIVVIVITVIIAGGIMSFLKPALDSFKDTRLRANMADQADNALRRVVRDVRHAVPNSLRSPSSSCFEMVPTITGGRYRTGPDASGNAKWLDPSGASSGTVFDTLTPMAIVPANGDYLVIDNQNGNDVYDGYNRMGITAVADSPDTTYGYKRITLDSVSVPAGYVGGRFSVVSQAEQSVIYICAGAGEDTNHNGTGTLYRQIRNFNSTLSSCPAVGALAKVLATHVKSCLFSYNPNEGATQQSGFLWMVLELERDQEIVHLAVGAHVMNAP